MSMPYNKRLRAAREGLGYTRAQVASALHIAPSNISNYELGKQTPKPATALRLNEYLGLEVEEVEEQTPNKILPLPASSAPAFLAAAAALRAMADALETLAEPTTH